MKPYEHIRLIENPDVADIQEEGRNTATGGRCYQKPGSKASSRRILKAKNRTAQERADRRDERYSGPMGIFEGYGE